MCMTLAGFSSANSATDRSEGLKLSIALLIRIKQPAWAGAKCFGMLFVILLFVVGRRLKKEAKQKSETVWYETTQSVKLVEHYTIT